MGVKASGRVDLLWTVELPDGRERDGVATDDPAIGAVLDFLPQSGFVYSWGEKNEPAQVWLESSDHDFEVYDDDRDPICFFPGCEAVSVCTLNEKDGAIIGHFCEQHEREMLARQIQPAMPPLATR